MTRHSPLEEALESYLDRPPDSRRPELRTLVKSMRQALSQGRPEQVSEALRRACDPFLDFTSATSLVQIHKKLEETSPDDKAARLRLAILGSITTDQLTRFIQLFLFAAGVEVEIYQAEFDVFRQEIFDPGSGLYAFGPDVVFLATGWRAIDKRPDPKDDPGRVAELLEAELSAWSSLWSTVHDRQGCQVLQNNFDPPPVRLLGNHEMRHPAALGRFVHELNRAMADSAPAYVSVHDLAGLCTEVGIRSFSDERYHHHAKLPCAPEHLVGYAHNVASVLAAGQGMSKKCLALDLDDTLWGGVVGDDGVSGIRLRRGDAEGEAFLAFQEYAQGLRQRGVILAVCSKNDEAIARQPFEEHPDMALGLDDISCFVANWDDKARNLRIIAHQLNIGLNSIVFVDDNPVERAVVRRLVPEVAVPYLPGDPAERIQALERHRYFQVAALAAEDFRRTDFYRADLCRDAARVEAGSLDDFLDDLDMRARVAPVGPGNLDRCVQLINKTNQFNLTTRRRSTAEIEAILQAEDWITLTVRLTDRYGDNGLISVLLARISGQELQVDTWLMSCRVLKRTVEHFVLNRLVEAARGRGLGSLKGEYIPTKKNALVRDHYPQLGFTEMHTDEVGRSRWELVISDAWEPAPTHVIESDGE